MKYFVTIDNDTIELELLESLDKVKMITKKKQENIDFTLISNNAYSMIYKNKLYYITISDEKHVNDIRINNDNYYVKVKNELEYINDKQLIDKKVQNTQNIVKAQIPGLISKVFVSEGDHIEVGQKLCILEAMKMENEIISSNKGIVKKIFIDNKGSVEKGDSLMEIINNA